MDVSIINTPPRPHLSRVCLHSEDRAIRNTYAQGFLSLFAPIRDVVVVGKNQDTLHAVHLNIRTFSLSKMGFVARQIERFLLPILIGGIIYYIGSDVYLLCAINPSLLTIISILFMTSLFVFTLSRFLQSMPPMKFLKATKRLGVPSKPDVILTESRNKCIETAKEKSQNVSLFAKTPIYTLPAEMIVEIFGFVDVQDLNNLSTTAYFYEPAIAVRDVKLRRAALISGDFSSFKVLKLYSFSDLNKDSFCDPASEFGTLLLGLEDFSISDKLNDASLALSIMGTPFMSRPLFGSFHFKGRYFVVQDIHARKISLWLKNNLVVDAARVIENSTAFDLQGDTLYYVQANTLKKMDLIEGTIEDIAIAFQNNGDRIVGLRLSPNCEKLLVQCNNPFSLYLVDLKKAEPIAGLISETGLGDQFDFLDEKRVIYTLRNERLLEWNSSTGEFTDIFQTQTNPDRPNLSPEIKFWIDRSNGLLYCSSYSPMLEDKLTVSVFDYTKKFKLLTQREFSNESMMLPQGHVLVDGRMEQLRGGVVGLYTL